MMDTLNLEVKDKIDVDALVKELIFLRRENEILKSRLSSNKEPLPEFLELKNTHGEKKLSNEEIKRFSRQLLVPEISIDGQTKLKNSSVLVVGAGGLGCPVLMYLAAGGVGKIGIIDGDLVELSNLHRQIIHDEASIGFLKALSAKAGVERIAASCNCIAYPFLLTPNNALEIFENYDIIVDATDNAPTRYLINDAAVFLKKPLVSACALKLQGHVTVYNYGEDCPCYRCLFPFPPPIGAVPNCSDGGVLNTVPGILGTIQAFEVIKICTSNASSLSRKMLCFYGNTSTFKTLTLREKRPECEACGENSSIIPSLFNYTEFCHTQNFADGCINLTILPNESRLTPAEYRDLKKSNVPHIVLDVRESVEFKICRLENSLNIPFFSLEKNILKISEHVHKLACSKQIFSNDIHVIFICRRGNQSQLAVQIFEKLVKAGSVNFKPKTIRDIVGGLHNWSRLNPEFPIY